MARIEQLDAHVADLIAAGEVVERPASVVKELVENAIDAGSSAVVVEIQRGGMGLIRVTDNGCGIPPAELPTAFLRHATSKLHRAEDLGKIGTLGFRGEALAAISAVSRVEIRTRQTGASLGAALHLEGGTPEAAEPVGTPEGTTIYVRDLFYNTPARLKFMRKDSAETAAVAGLMQHLALSHPDVSFQFVKDGTESLHTPGDGKLDSAIYAALGREFARGLLAVSGRGGDVAVSGFVTPPLLGRGSRSMQVFFVNGRYIKSQLLTAALEEGYRNQIMKGKFPGCVLCVQLPVTAVDVNVHPAKTQVKFAREGEVFDAVYHTVLDALAEKGAAVPAPKAELPRQDFFRTMDTAAYRQSAESARSTPPAGDAAAPRTQRPGWNSEWKTAAPVADSGRVKPAYTPAPRPAALGRAPASVASGVSTPEKARSKEMPSKEMPSKEMPEGALSEKQAAPAAQRFSQPAGAFSPTTPAAQRETETAALPRRPFVPAIPPEQQTLVLPGLRMQAEKAEAPWRIAGEVLHTYIICESDDGSVWLIDKHAAHERINFDRLKAAEHPPMRQTLLRPIAAELSREDGALLLENLPLLEQFGFSCEDFGDGAILVREVPADIDAADTTATLEEFAEHLRTGRDVAEKRENLLHTMACKAAIKGGWVSDPAELRVLVEKVQSGAVRFCPHGRPVAVKLTRYELEKMFKRA